MGVSKEKMTVVPMGISLGMFPYQEKQPEIEQGIKRVVYIGTMVKSRRMDFLLRVFKKVHSRNGDTRLYMVGGSDFPEDLEYLAEVAQECGISQLVEFTGLVSREEALDYVNNSSVCVSPFYPTPILNSTSPTKLIEYMAMGKAVVANHHPEQLLVISESGSGLCVAYDEDEFAEAILSLLQQPQLSAEMGRRGRKYVEENRSYPKIADDLEKKYLRILESR
jgi:glycosyltransferase involved in cell wall biosynthesis